MRRVKPHIPGRSPGSRIFALPAPSRPHGQWLTRWQTNRLQWRYRDGLVPSSQLSLNRHPGNDIHLLKVVVMIFSNLTTVNKVLDEDLVGSDNHPY